MSSMFTLHRASFRQLLTIAFLLVPALLALVSVRQNTIPWGGELLVAH